LEEGDFFAGQLGQLAVGRLGLQRRGVFHQVGKDFQVALAGGGQFLEARVFAGEFLGFGGIIEQLGIAQRRPRRSAWRRANFSM
jgi:hypothetical protein